MRQFSFGVFVAAAFVVCPFGASAAGDEEATIQEWITALGEADFEYRERATASLIVTGPAAIASVRKAAFAKNPEVSARAIRILKAWFNSEEDETHEAALQELRQIAQSQEIVAAASARAVLAPQAETLAWVKQAGGDVTMDKTRREHRLVELNLDRARGIDPGFYADSLQDIDLARLRPLRDLRSLTLENRTAMTDAGLEHLSSLKKLATLNLSRTSLSGSGLRHLANLPRLRSLNLGSCPALRDDALLALGNIKSLRTLILDGTSNAWCHDELWMINLRFPGRDQLRQYRGGISDAGLRQLSQLRELTSLSLVKTQITDEGLPALQPLTQLESLDLSRTAVTSAGLTHVGSLDHLKVLKINFTPIADDGLRKLKGLHNLEELQLRGSLITDAGLAELRGLTKLRTLDLYGTTITDAAIDVLKDLPNLDSLQLGQTQISFRGLQKLGRVAAHFRFDDALLAGELAQADEHREIVSVNLNGKQLADEDLQYLQSFRCLRSLTLQGTPITDRGLAHLRGLTLVSSLDLGNTAITDEGLAQLQGMKALQHLGIRDTKVTLPGALDLLTKQQSRSLGNALQVAGYVGGDEEYPVLYRLDTLTKTTTETFSPSKELRPIERLQTGKSPSGRRFVDLGGAGVSDREIVRLAELSNIGAILLDDNPLSDAALGHLGQRTQLELLWISGKQITGAGLARLRPLTNLHTLWITDAKLTDDDLAPLAALPKLQILNLSGTNIGDGAVSHLRRCKSLTVLIIDNMAISEAAVQSLKKSLPGLHVQLSQKRAIALIRGRERKDKTLPHGYHRAKEMGAVRTKAAPVPLLGIFGDAHFEQAEVLDANAVALTQIPQWKNLNTLKTVNIVNQRVPADAVAVLQQLPQLRSISFYGSRLGNDSLAVLAGAGLEELNLENTTITDDGLAHLRHLKNLKVLALGGYGTKIGDGGMEHVARLAGLTALSLNRTNFSDAAMVQLKSLEKLKRLDLREVKIGDGAKHLGQLKNIESLDLSFTFVSDETLQQLYGLVGLKRLSLEETYVTPLGVRDLQRRLPSLQIFAGTQMSERDRRAAEPLRQLLVRARWDAEGNVVDLDCRNLASLAGTQAHMGKFPALRLLKLGSGATDLDLRGLRQLRKLVELDLTDSDVGDAGLEQLSEASSLTTLRLGGTKVSARGLAALHRIETLKYLVLNHTHIDDEGAKHVGKFSRLESLNLADTKLSDVGLTQLADLKNLEVLVLEGTSVSDAGLKKLHRMSKLRELHVSRTRVSQNGADSLKKLLPNCQVHWRIPSQQ